MKNTFILLFVSLLFCASCNVEKQSATSDFSNPAQYVNPLIGTDAHGHTFPGTSLPFGMVQLSPDTRLEGRDGCGGYH